MQYKRIIGEICRTLHKRCLKDLLMRASVMVFAGLLVFPSVGTYAQGINDAQIASIVVTANQVDDAGELASATASDAAVKKFAQLMITIKWGQ